MHWFFISIIDTAHTHTHTHIVGVAGSGNPVLYPMAGINTNHSTCSSPFDDLCRLSRRSHLSVFVSSPQSVPPRPSTMLCGTSILRWTEETSGVCFFSWTIRFDSTSLPLQQQQQPPTTSCAMVSLSLSVCQSWSSLRECGDGSIAY